jgi:phosphatidate cytidylyltransferase
MLRTRLITALVLLLTLGVALFCAPAWLWALLVMAVGLVASWEWAGLAQFSGVSRAFYVFTTAALAALLCAFMQPNAQATLMVLFAASAAFWLLLAPLWLVRQWRVERASRLALCGWVLIIPTGFALIQLRTLGPWVLLCVLTVIFLSDSAAYFAGRVFGRHKLAPAISPGKTWEGVVGALLAVSVYAAWLMVGLPQHNSVLMRAAQVSGWAFLPWVLLIVVLGIEGDLFESWIKRCAGAKDSGHLLPGHGGVLDRIDALTAALPLAAALLTQAAA